MNALYIVIGFAILLVGTVIMAVAGVSQATAGGVFGVAFGVLVILMGYAIIRKIKTPGPKPEAGMGTVIFVYVCGAVLFIGGLALLIAQPT